MDTTRTPASLYRGVSCPWLPGAGSLKAPQLTLLQPVPRPSIPSISTVGGASGQYAWGGDINAYGINLLFLSHYLRYWRAQFCLPLTILPRCGMQRQAEVLASYPQMSRLLTPARCSKNQTSEHHMSMYPSLPYSSSALPPAALPATCLPACLFVHPSATGRSTYLTSETAACAWPRPGPAAPAAAGCLGQSPAQVQTPADAAPQASAETGTPVSPAGWRRRLPWPRPGLPPAWPGLRPARQQLPPPWLRPLPRPWQQR